jgi:cytochrome c oxidase subunit II
MHALLNNLATAAPASASAVGEANFWLPRSASSTAPNVDFMFMAITYISYFFFVLVVALMILFVVRYRQRGTKVERHEGAIEHHTPLEVTWTVVPVILVVIIFFGGFKGYLTLATPPANSYQIDVVAKQWSWTFKYPNGAISDDLYVPVGRPVKLIMRSDDVLHSLYIPDFRVKKDVVPARYTVLWFQANAVTGKRADGTEDFHSLFCTEYCGKDHSRMNRKVFVLSEDAFKVWEYEQSVWIDKIADADLYSQAGPKLYPRCASCHSLDGSGNTGPSWGPSNGLPGIWERTEKGLTKLNNGKSLGDLIGVGKEFATPEGYIRSSILNPNKHIVGGFAGGMPTFQGQLKDREIDALIGMMKKLNEFDSKGKWKSPEAPK